MNLIRGGLESSPRVTNPKKPSRHPRPSEFCDNSFFQ
jgi:hypothetical protein